MNVILFLAAIIALIILVPLAIWLHQSAKFREFLVHVAEQRPGVEAKT